MENIMNFIPEFMGILIVSIYILGVFFKNSSLIKDKWITVLLLLFGITFAVLLNIINVKYKVALDVIVNGILQGILCWGVAVGVNQTIKQVKKEE